MQPQSSVPPVQPQLPATPVQSQSSVPPVQPQLPAIPVHPHLPSQSTQLPITNAQQYSPVTSKALPQFPVTSTQLQLPSGCGPSQPQLPSGSGPSQHTTQLLNISSQQLPVTFAQPQLPLTSQLPSGLSQPQLPIRPPQPDCNLVQNCLFDLCLLEEDPVLNKAISSIKDIQSKLKQLSDRVKRLKDNYSPQLQLLRPHLMKTSLP